MKTGGGFHYYLASQSIGKISNRTNILPGVDLRGENGYVVAPPSLHSSGVLYEVSSKKSIVGISDEIMKFLEKKNRDTSNNTAKSKQKLQEGNRNNFLTSLGGFLLSKGMGLSEIDKVLNYTNKFCADVPLLDDEIKSILRSVGKFSNSHQWNPPIPIETRLPKPIAVRLIDLPKNLRPWVSYMSDRMQVPLDFCAAPLIVGIASVIGRKRTIYPLKYDRWEVVPNLWGLLVSQSGTSKSPVISAAMRPIEKLASIASQQFTKECQRAQLKNRSIQIEIEALKQSLKVDISGGFMEGLKEQKSKLEQLEEQHDTNSKIKEKRYKTNDPTIEKLATLLKENPKGLLLLRDEISGWLESMFKSGREGSKEFYLEAWNGNSSHSIDRVGRGTVHVESMCLSVFGGIQPPKLEEYIKRNSSKNGDDGFLARFQIAVYPELDLDPQFVDKQRDVECEDQLFQMFKALDDIPLAEEDQKKPLAFCDEAQALFNRWRQNLERRIRKSTKGEMFKSFLGKYRKLVPSLALIFQLVEDFGQSEAVNTESLKRAIKWAEILESHLKRILATTIHNPESSGTILAEKIMEGRVVDGDKVRDIQRKNWSGLKTAESLESAFDFLESLNWIKIEKNRSRGGFSERIRLNPKLAELRI